MPGKDMTNGFKSASNQLQTALERGFAAEPAREADRALA
jgi:hypothetical protein